MLTIQENTWREYRNDLEHFIRRRVSDEVLVEEILQDVLVKVQAGLDRLKDPGSLRFWIYRICRHTIIDYYRRKKSSAETLGQSSAERLIVDPKAEEKKFQQDLDTCIREMVQNMPAKYSQALMLTTYEGLTQREMSELLGISLSGAKSRVQRAREMLKNNLLGCCHLEFDTFGKIIDYRPKSL